MTKRWVALVLAMGVVISAAGHAQADTPSAGATVSSPVVQDQMMTPATSEQSFESVGKKPALIAVGAAAGYILMMNPYGAAVMGAAMGGMLAASLYASYTGTGAH